MHGLRSEIDQKLVKLALEQIDILMVALCVGANTTANTTANTATYTLVWKVVPTSEIVRVSHA